MFASLKNKIREEIGSDVSTVVRNAGSVKNNNSKHLSRTESSSSVSESQISLDESFDSSATISSSPAVQYKTDNNIYDIKLTDGLQLTPKDYKKLENREIEWKRKLIKKDYDCQKKIDKKDDECKIKILEKEKEWKKLLDKQEKDKLKLEDDKLKAESARRTLELALRDAEEYKKKLHSFQEDAEQLEGYQTQEMAKIKHLLLSKEQEAEEKSNHLKTALSEIENLKSELSRLRRYEDELNNVQDEMETLRHTTQREKAQLSGELAQTKEEVRHLNVKNFVLEQRVAQSNNQTNVDERIADLMRERTLLERKLEETHLHLSDIKTSWSGKISSLETQVGRLSRQAGEEGVERRRVEEENDKLKQRVKQLENDIEVNNVVIATKDAKLLRMTEDIDEMAIELKELRASVDDEVEEFKRQIKSSEEEIQCLKIEKDKCLKQYNETKIELEQLRIACNAEKENNSSLNIQLECIRENLKLEKENSDALRINFEYERNEKDSILLRNAQVSQDYEIALQKKRQQEIENIELQNKIDNLEKKLLSFENIETDKKNNEVLEKTLRNNLTDLEDQLNEKTKTIKVLQQRLGDMKKTLQRELRVPSSSFDSDIDQSVAILSPSSSKTITAKNSNTQDDDVNFKYLKHVLIKFLTSRECEALHLTRAVATLLHFSPEEEKLLQETLEWKMSWFGSRPNLGIGQTANSIPPS